MASESVWAAIARLRIKDPHLLAPAIESAWDRGRMACAGRHVNVALPGHPEDLVALGGVSVVETLRVQELQTIYHRQGTSRVSNVLRGWHAYGLAFDLIHADFGWFTNRASVVRWPDAKARQRASVLWYRAVADVFTAPRTLAWGGLWRTFPDSPHFQAAVVPVTPTAAIIAAYEAAGGALAGRRAVWRMYHLE